MTGTLTVRYRRPTPLHRDLRFEGTLDRVEGRKIFTTGRCFDGDDVTAEAEGLFIPVDFQKIIEMMTSRDAPRPDPQAPFQFGGRFSAKARGPSMKSSDAAMSATRRVAGGLGAGARRPARGRGTRPASTPAPTSATPRGSRRPSAGRPPAPGPRARPR